MLFHCEYPPYESLNVMGCGCNKLSNWLLQNFDESNIVRSGESIKDVAPTGAPVAGMVHQYSGAKYGNLA